MASRCLIHRLDDPTLEMLFSTLPFGERLSILPLVCKRWARLLGQPSTVVWDSVRFDVREVYRWGTAAGRPLSEAGVVSAWFGRRANCVTSLGISLIEPQMSVNSMSAMVASTIGILGSQCGSSRQLQFLLGTVGLLGPDIAVVAALTRLQQLEVSVYNVLFADLGATLLQTVHLLPVLTHLAIRHRNEVINLLAPVSANHGLPTCKELGQLRSRSLTHIFVDMLGGPPDGNTLKLSGLPELRSATVYGGDPDMPLNLRIDGSRIQGALQLQNLDVENDQGLQLQRGSLQYLSALTSLRLVQCGLSSVPADVALLGGRLRVLDLCHNEDMQVDAIAANNILQCSFLEDIYLFKHSMVQWADSLGNHWQAIEQRMAQVGYTPAQYSMDSVNQMVKLPDAFNMRHGRRLHVCLDDVC